MDAVEKVSPTGAAITITFVVMVTAAINLRSFHGKILKNHNQRQ
jgi:hypothetical protein